MSEICREFFEAYHNVFHDDYHSWNSPLTRSSESFSGCLACVCVRVRVCVCVCVCVCMFCLLTPVLFQQPSLTASNQQIYDLY